MFQKKSVSEKLYAIIREGGGGIKLFRRIFFVSLCRKLSQGNPSVLCLRKFAVAIKIMDKRTGGIKIFRKNIFCLRVPEHFVGENSCAVFQKVSGCKKLYG